MFFEINPATVLSQPTPNDAYFAEALTFCKAWASGQQTFERTTSGSTGTPKAIVLTRTQMQASAQATAAALGLASSMTAVVCLNISYIAGTMMLVRGMVIGMKIIVVQPTANPLAELPDTKLDFVAFVPMQIQKLLTDNEQDRLNKFKSIIVGGAAVGAALEKQIYTLSVPVYATYGMTETVSHVALRKINENNLLPFYTLISGIEAGTDERQCLRIRGAVTNDEWVQTNDVVNFKNERMFELLGRADNIINSGGVKIQLEKIESVIEKIGLDVRFFCWHKPDERLGQKLLLVVEGQPQKDILTHINEILKKNLKRYEIPKEVVFIEKFVETATNKINKPQTFELQTIIH
jgi:o-succinylbenzoate---CoA ligase